VRVVLDASVAVKWFLDDEEFVPEARVLFEALRADQISFCAPGTLHAEFGHAMRGAFLEKRVRHALLLDACNAMASSPIEILEVAGLTTAAMQLSLKHAGSFYDAIYVALAIREDLQVVTGDRSMCNAFAKLSRCTHIADFKL
jgi:predicted nucleic acid-binding protein